MSILSALVDSLVNKKDRSPAPNTGRVFALSDKLPPQQWRDPPKPNRRRAKGARTSHHWRKAIIHFAARHEYVTGFDIGDLVDCSDETAKKVMNRMVNEGFMSVTYGPQGIKRYSVTFEGRVFYEV